MRQQAAEWASRSAAVGSSTDAIARVGGRLIADLDSAERRLMKVGFRGALDRPNIPPTINTRLAELCEVVAVADFAPPRQAYDVFEVLSRRAGDELASLRTTIGDRRGRVGPVDKGAWGADDRRRGRVKRRGSKSWPRSPVYGASVLCQHHGRRGSSMAVA